MSTNSGSRRRPSTELTLREVLYPSYPELTLREVLYPSYPQQITPVDIQVKGSDASTIGMSHLRLFSFIVCLMGCFGSGRRGRSFPF